MAKAARDGMFTMDLGATRKAAAEAAAEARGVSLADLIRYAVDRDLMYPPAPVPVAYLPPAPPPPVTPRGGARPRKTPPADPT